MNRLDEVNAKMQADKAYYAQTPNLTGCASPGQPYYGETCAQERRSSPTEQAEKNFANHSEQAMKSQMAAVFLRANPAFDEFIQLIRSGAIQI